MCVDDLCSYVCRGFCKKVKENLQLCAQRPTAVCMDFKDLNGSAVECADQNYGFEAS